MMLSITAQVKEAGVAWDKGEKKSEASLYGWVGAAALRVPSPDFLNPSWVLGIEGVCVTDELRFGVNPTQIQS